ncbi:hypothetical protein VTO42DRAFT_6975 [Malbranchea cinnamomea]
MPSPALKAILESKKTVSRKARNKAASHQGSRVNSRVPSPHSSPTSSQNVSRYATDEEDNASIEDMMERVNFGDTESSWGFEFDDTDRRDEETLDDIIEALTDHKRSSIDSRVRDLTAYIRMLTSQYVDVGLDVNEVLVIFARNIKNPGSDKEATLALKAVALTALTTQDEFIYESMRRTIENAIHRSTSPAVKAAAIHCLGAITFWSGSVEDMELQMQLFMDIITSDGHSIDAGDDADVVTAALEEWGFLATEIEDLELESEGAVEAFAEQLESSATNVQIAAGENIALLYEKSVNQEEDEEEISDDESSPPKVAGTPKYDAYHDTRRIINQVQGLAHISGRHIKKRDKRSLHMNFTSILTTVENPVRGPMYSKALDSETHEPMGSRMLVKLHDGYVVRTDRWWKWLRLAAIKRLLGGGFIDHYNDGNPAVVDFLPVEIVEERKPKKGKRS